MEAPKTFNSEEVLTIYRDGQRQGFIAGVIACLAVKYLSDRRKVVSTTSRRYPWGK